MSLALSEITDILNLPNSGKDHIIDFLLTDSRKLQVPSNTLFFAIVTDKGDGHRYITSLYERGVKAFVISNPFFNEVNYPDAVFLKTADTLCALQLIAATYRGKFNIPVIGITGSNGKTIVKEWLSQLLEPDYRIVKNPKSFNSQIGVPLSIWQISAAHTLGIFEAGISLPEEMKKLAAIIQPTIGILTNIGEAHTEGLGGSFQKLQEKLQLFNTATVLIIRDIEAALLRQHQISINIPLITWGTSANALFQIATEIKQHSTLLTITHQHQTESFSIPYLDKASVENIICCYIVLHHLQIPPATAAARIQKLQPINMRLEQINGSNNTIIVNDSYSLDITSLSIALDYVEQLHTYHKKTIILSDILQAGDTKKTYATVFSLIEKKGFQQLIGIGEQITAAMEQYNFPPTIKTLSYTNTNSLLKELSSLQLQHEIILLKGARVFTFERIAAQLTAKVHQTVLEINLNAIEHNIAYYKRRLNPLTKIMAMVKAFAYGSGGTEIAGLLAFHNVDYLGVAYADEGIELRKAGIVLPIMVMNPEISTFAAMVHYNLEPDLYSFEMFQAFMQHLKTEGIEQYPIHIEIETGMNRLGFQTEEWQKLTNLLMDNNTVTVKSIFSHFAASEDETEDTYTDMQYNKLLAAITVLQPALPYPVLRHIANSSGALRFPAYQLDMVRLGIGMYGIGEDPNLEPAVQLKTTVALVKSIKAGETVSYNRKGVAANDMLIATVRIGYADGYKRSLGYGIGKMLIKGQLAPVVGTICMDMTMLDVTNIPAVNAGDEVIVFGEEIPIQQVAGWAKTIPYEIMTGISHRVKRVYYQE